METKEYSVYNTTKESFLISGVTVIDTTLEPLKVLRVLIEGLALNAETGLWLTPLASIPMVPRLSPFDLVYLDKEYRVVEGQELLPGVDFPPFKGEAASALVLPLHSLSSSQTILGDTLSMSEVEAMEMPSVPTPVPTIAFPELQSARVAVEPPAKVRLPFPIEVPPIQPGTEPQGRPSPRPQVARPAFNAPVMQNAQLTQDEPVYALQIPNRPEIEPELRDEQAPFVAASNLRELTPVAPVYSPSQNPSSPPSEINKKAKPKVQEKASFKTNMLRAADELVRQVPRIYVPDSNGHDKESLKTRFLQWLYEGTHTSERRISIRRPLPGLVAYDGTGVDSQPHEIGDISATGAYLLTDQRWAPGTKVSLTLQRLGPSKDHEREIALQAGAVRWGRDGVGLSFVLPEGMEFHLWEGPLRTQEQETYSEYFLREFRLAKALTFLRRICPPAFDELRLVLYEGISAKRVASAVEIALKAEELLATDRQSSKLHAPPSVVMRVLGDGSWTDEAWVRHLWAGILATSCTLDGNDESNLVYADLLDQLTPVHLRIFAGACAKATKVISGGGAISAYPLYCSAEELIAVSGTNNLRKIQQVIAHLSNFGLLAESARSSYISPTEKTKTTPTSLGLEMYARCSGLRGTT